MKKVIVTKEVAEAIEDVRKAQYTNADIIADIINDRGHTAYGTLMPTLIEFSRQSESNIDVLMQALVNGYEIEKTAEDKLAGLYKGAKSSARMYAALDEWSNCKAEEGKAKGIQLALDTLGIKIEGVNA